MKRILVCLPVFASMLGWSSAFALVGCGGPPGAEDEAQDETNGVIGEGVADKGDGTPADPPEWTAGLVAGCDDVLTWDPTWTQYEDQVLTLVNQRRAGGASCGSTYFAKAPALTFDDRLRCAARKHSKDMGVKNFFSHTGTDDSSFAKRITDAGYIYTAAAENIAAGNPTPAEVVDAWMNSVSHCTNIMAPILKNLGTGYYYASSSTYKHYWTEDFGRQDLPQTTARPRFDFDGDGKADASVFRPSDGTWYIRRPDGAAYGPQFGQSGDVPVAADYDGDGKSDAAVFRAGAWYRQRSTAGFDAVTYGQAADIPAPGDYDGDGKTDVAVFRPSTKTFYLLLSSNGQTPAVQFGAAGDIPVPGDFDGDSKTDISVFRPSDGTWYRLNSSNGALAAVQFGTNGDRPVAGDFDGDHKADPAVFRPSDGSWYVLASSSGSLVGTAFGLAEDTPVPADYDGDGKDDIAVFRPSTAAWYRLNSGDNGFVAFQFGVSTDVPAPALR